MVILRSIFVRLLSRSILSRDIPVLLLTAFFLCVGFEFDALAGSVSALMTYEKGIDALKDGNCKIL
ncbi:hypothetical protein MBAV_000127, partial [Candidatus Magnetobacterium bavaricum]